MINMSDMSDMSDVSYDMSDIMRVCDDMINMSGMRDPGLVSEVAASVRQN